jgi:hypothetical protein
LAAPQEKNKEIAMIINKKLAVVAALLLGSTSAVLAGGNDGRGRDATRYERPVIHQRAAQPRWFDNRKGTIVNSYAPGASTFGGGPGADERRWMDRASRLSSH